jgi:hypothetical protein
MADGPTVHFDGENDFLPTAPAPKGPMAGEMFCVCQGSSYKWNGTLGAWVKVSGEGPNFVRPSKPPEAERGG